MQPAWWQTGIVYQIYPRSFQDSNADGVGDLRGIIRRLPYLSELGVDALWLSPLFTSPMADFGYDIADYTGIDPIFGAMADFDALLEATHAHGLKLILDLVPNHTSDRHPWFLESRASRENAKRDWYLWRDPDRSGGPPNNWLSEFGGSAWQFDEETGQYYYHAFLKEQPDLNWRNRAVRRAIYEAMRFWLRKGVDGFRIDVLWHLLKDERFRDNPPNPKFKPGDPPHHALVPVYTTDLPEIHDVVAEMRRVTEEFDARVLIGEIYLPIERLVRYYGRNLDGVHLPFNFTLLNTRWHSRNLASLIHEYETALPEGGWPNWVLGNHDRPRIATRVGRAQAKIAAMLLLTLRGTPTIYYGEEIGMTDIAVPPGQARDPFERNVPGKGLGRDGCRSPMQWDASPYAGFSTVAPWLPVGDVYRAENVENLRRDETSIYALYRRLTALRRARKALTMGRYVPVSVAQDLLLYVRAYAHERFLIALNLNDVPAAATLPDDVAQGRVTLSSFNDRAGEIIDGTIDLRPAEGLIVELGAAR
jgi:alpha-glucosidase